MRSFSSIWYWLVVVGLWMWTAQRVLGVPLDLIMHVHRHPEDERAERDMRDLLRVNAERAAAVPGVLNVAVAAFLLSAIVALSFAGLEMAQAVACIAVPMAVVVLLRMRLARRISGMGTIAATKALIWHRMFVQMIAMVSIFSTAVWGMFRNLGLAVLN
ncbi:component of SufBCD complex [Cereibacter sp. SYSU M97828]|nr:component of SufBCD complex [Cereibacter flavus]